MNAQIRYAKLMMKANADKDTRILQHINKPDPVVLGFMQTIQNKVMGFVRAND